MLSQRSVLIVDRSQESREVLRTALERRGMLTYEAGKAEVGLELVRAHHPDLIVLDLEVDAGGTADMAAYFEEVVRDHSTPILLLGSVRRKQQAGHDAKFVAKPYHYAPLILKIEQLLDNVQQPTA